MKPRLPIALLLAAAHAAAGWVPDSPIVRVGEDIDIYFTAKARLEYDSNLFFGSNNGLPGSGTSWIVGPGLDVDFFKEANFSSTVKYRREYVRFFSSALSGLDDERDIAEASITYDGGGPLTLQADALYQEDARNTTETVTLGGLPNGSLLRQTNYSQSITTGYRFTDKLKASLVASHRSNRYDPRVRSLVAGPNPGDPPVPVYTTQGVTESDGWTFPLNISYQVRPRLNVALTYEHGKTDLTQARNSTAPLTYAALTKDFYGATLSGQPTESGKLDVVVKIGVLRSAYDDGVDPKTGASYSISLTHTLTEKFKHGVEVGDDANVAVNGLRSDTRTARYTVNYVMDESFRATAFVGYNTSDVAATDQIRTGSFGINATYSPDSHWSYLLGYSLSQAYNPSRFDVHQVSLEANLRW